MSKGGGMPAPCRNDRLNVVDLGALEFAAVIDIDRLPFGKDLERGPAPFAVAVARPLDTAERHMSFGADRRRIDIGNSGAEVADRTVGVIDVLSVDGRRETVLGIVRETDRFLERFHLEDRQ